MSCMSASLKVGVIGLGRMGQLYARLLATQIVGVYLYAIAEVNTSARQQIADELAIPHAYAEPEELLEIPELDAVIVVNLRFLNGALGNVEVSRNAFYGYDIRTEILGSEGALQIGRHQHTPLLMLTRAGAQYNVTPYLMERFGDAYRAQLQHFVQCLREGHAPAVGGEDTLVACTIAVAATKAYQTSQPVKLSDLK